MDATEEIEIGCDFLDPSELKQEIESADAIPLTGIRLRLRRGPSEDRSVENAVLVAVIQGGFTILTTLITILIERYKEKGVIRVRFRNGHEIEFPANMPRERIREVIQDQAKDGVASMRISRKP